MEIVENAANLEAAALKLDWETIQEDPELELWAIRVPVGVGYDFNVYRGHD